MKCVENVPEREIAGALKWCARVFAERIWSEMGSVNVVAISLISTSHRLCMGIDGLWIDLRKCFRGVIKWQQLNNCRRW